METEETTCIHRLFEKQADKIPDEIALIFEGKTMTYGELERRSNQFGHYLQSLGAGPEVLVGICLKKSFDMIIAVFGILKAGAAYAPIDDETPLDLVNYVLEDCQTDLVITEKILADKFSAYTKKLILFDENSALYEKQSTERVISNVLPENLACVLYTSGSTGRPKGTLIEHKSIHNVLESVRKEPGISKNDKFIMLSRLSFDVGTLEIFGTLMVGSQLKIIRGEILKNAPELRKEIEDGITFFTAGPFLYKMLIEAGWKGNKSLRLITTGEALPPNTAALLLDRCGELWNMGGPTETTVLAWGCQLKKGDPITIGYPVLNTSVYILDENQQKVADGEKGEIYISGPGVARGYLNRPELTAEKFLPNPYSNVPGTIMYRSGDVGRMLGDGKIEYLGRTDYQVKIHGLRIELGEIENVIVLHPRISQAAVLMIEDEMEDKKLIAYIREEKSGGEKELSVTGQETYNKRLKEDLQQFCVQKLNPFMVPKVYIILEKFPTNKNGKIDRKALPKPEESTKPVTNDANAPQTFQEKILSVIWAEILKLPKVGIHDNFFDIGGNSLLSIQMINQANKMGLNITVAQLLQHPTINKLIELSNEEEEEIENPSIIPFNKNGDKPKMFYIPTNTGNYNMCKALAEYLGDDQPFYYVLPVGGEGKAEPLTSVEDIAKHQVKEITNIQPEGPYYLTGFCFGGYVAYEIAQQLKAAGHEVGLVILIDSYTNNSTYPMPGKSFVSRKKEIIKYQLKTMASMAFRERPAHIWKRNKKGWIIKVTRPLIKADHNQGSNKAKNDLALAIHLAQSTYVPKGYDGDVSVIRVSEIPSSKWVYHDPGMGWDKLVRGELKYSNVPGNHITFFEEPNIKVVAETIKSVLEGAYEKNTVDA